MRLSGKVLLGVVVLWWAAPVFADGPELLVDQPVFAFGEVLQGQTVEHVFVLHNQGKQTLHIDRVRSSCGCTAALLSADDIDAGGSGEVRAIFNSGRFRGPVEKTIYLYTNDPRQAAATLHLRGTVVPELETVPAEVNFGPLTAGERREISVTLINRGQNPLTLKSASASRPWLQVKMPAASLAPGEKAELLVGAVPSGKGPANGYIFIRTDSAQVPEVRLAARGYVSSGQENGK